MKQLTRLIARKAAKPLPRVEPVCSCHSAGNPNLMIESRSATERRSVVRNKGTENGGWSCSLCRGVVAMEIGKPGSTFAGHGGNGSGGYWWTLLDSNQ